MVIVLHKRLGLPPAGTAPRPRRCPAKRVKKRGRPAQYIGKRGRPAERSPIEAQRLHREVWTREYRAKQSRNIRDIAPLDASGINWDRRLACAHDLWLFGETYLPKVFDLPVCQDHLKCIRKLETVFLEGGVFALALPRAGGKTAWCRAAILWGTAYGHRLFPFFIGSMHNKAIQTLEFIKTYWYMSKQLAEDFPEIAYPFRRLENRYHLAPGQLYRGQPTHIEWASDNLRYPCLLLDDQDAAPYQEHCPDFLTGVPDHNAYVVRSAGVIIRTAGIDGSIRGEAEVHPITLQQPRPDVVLLDDTQKDQRAESPASCDKLIRMIDGAVQGLSGPNKSIASIMPCTVIREGDVSDTYLDREKKPEWQGERCSMVVSWPEGITNDTINLESEAGKLWTKYSDLRRESLQRFGDLHLATDFYSEHREDMDRGFVVSWEERYEPKEISAQQHAMNLRFRNPLTFLSEYQNRPRSATADQVPIVTPSELAERIIALPRGSVPAGCHNVVAFVDVQNEILFWTILACDLDYTGAVIDYGTWPPVSTRYFRRNQTEGWGLISSRFFRKHPESKSKAERVEGKKLRAPFEAKIYFALRSVCDFLFSREFPLQDEHGTSRRIGKLGIDARWGKASDVIKRLCREYGRPDITPCYGQGISPAYKQYEEYQRTKGWIFEDQVNPTVREVKWIYRLGSDGHYYLSMDVSRLKTFLFSRLAQPGGSRGSISLFEAEPIEHRMFADHVAGSEYPEPVTARGRTKDQWKQRDGRPDNDYLDCLVGCIALASTLGASLQIAGEAKADQAGPLRRRKLSEIWKAKRESEVV